MLCGQGDATCAVLIDFGLARRSDVQAEDDGDGEVPPTSKVSPGASPGTLPLPYPYPYPTPNQVSPGASPGASPARPLRRVCTPAYSAIGSPAFMAPEQVSHPDPNPDPNPNPSGAGAGEPP